MVALRQKDRDLRRKRRALLSLALSLAGHAALLALMLFLSHVHFGEAERTVRPATASPIALRPINADQWAQNRGAQPPDPLRAPAASKSPRKKEEKKPEKAPKGQVVDVAPGNGQESPDAKYLAESSNTVKKETRAKEQTPLYRNAMPQRTSPQPSKIEGGDPVERAAQAGNSGLGDDDRPLRDGAKAGALEVPDVKARSEVAMKLPTTEGPGLAVSNRTELEALKGNSTRLKLAPGSLDPNSHEETASGGRAGTAPMNLLPSPSVLDKVAGAAPNDHLKDVDEAEGTFLNTREWKYASFFNRLKQTIGYHWDPNSQLRLRDPTGQIYWGRDRETLLQVTLDGQGHLHDVFVQQPSGLDFLDVEAVKSFERSQPFPNPPPGLGDPDGMVHFTFGFHVTLTNTPGARLFRSTN